MPGSGKIDFDGWTFNGGKFDELVKEFTDALKEDIQEVFTSELNEIIEARLSFGWSEREHLSNLDPLSVTIMLDCQSSADTEQNLAWAFNFSDALLEEVKDSAPWDECHGDRNKFLIAARDKLRELANEIDAALEEQKIDEAKWRAKFADEEP